MNRMVISGTPRTPSIRPTHVVRITGRRLVRPRARSTPSGNDSRIDSVESTIVNMMPLHRLGWTAVRTGAGSISGRPTSKFVRMYSAATPVASQSQTDPRRPRPAPTRPREW